ncbi:MAG: hypothetical protein P4L42_08070 [Desulfocapsaceae bacterium]|nr:hypothetical protein [Desulfocapsaceae bacterium]
MIRKTLPHVLALLLWVSFCQADLVRAAFEDPLEIPPDVFWSNIRISQELADFFEKRSNLKTGLSLSYYGDERPAALYGTQIYDAGLRLIADSAYSQNIIETFSRNSSSGASRNSPQIAKSSNASKDGIFSWIRIEGFEQPQWWNTWEWSIKTGENAWFGKGALHYYRQTHDPQGLQIAQERAAFILGLQDQDGAVRVGPVNPQDNFWWNVKSTEDNESALNFLDEIYLTTHDLRYKQAADRIYEWLITTMYNREQHLFLRGEVFKQDSWVPDELQVFSADTTSWAPLQRILEDPRFGQNRRDRLEEVERMLAATVTLTGIFQNDILKGISYSPRSKEAAVISVEWSSQLALRYLQMSSEYHDEGVLAKAIEYHQKYVDMLGQLQGYIQESGGEKTVPVAVYPDGRVAGDEPLWDNALRSSRAYASIASHLYLGFALQRFDPLLDRNI